MFNFLPADKGDCVPLAQSLIRGALLPCAREGEKDEFESLCDYFYHNLWICLS